MFPPMYGVSCERLRPIEVEPIENETGTLCYTLGAYCRIRGALRRFLRQVC